VMDVAMPGLNGLEATREIRKRFPNIRVLALTMHRDPQYAFRLQQAGAAGYLLKDSAKEALLAALQAVMRGEMYLSPEVSRQMQEAYLQRGDAVTGATSPFDTLTTREREILQRIAEGYTSRQIAGQLAISAKTVNNHRARIMDKLNIRDIAGLTRFAVQNGLIRAE
jgi:DNA-binding NarL/FixJ family response regulator